MGGMVAQRVATTLIGGGRLATLSLSVTGRYYSAVPISCLGVGFYKFVLNWALPTNPAVMIDYLIPKCFTPEYLATIDSATGSTYEQLWRKRWNAEYREWFSLHDIDICAALSVVAGRHHLADEEVSLLRNSGVPILHCVSLGDTIFSPSLQHGLAKDLGGRVHESHTSGHLGGDPVEFEAFLKAVTDHLLSAA